MTHSRYLMTCLAFTLLSAAPPTHAGQPPAKGQAAEPAAKGGNLTKADIAASVTGAMDRSVDPCQDFYKYACGTWLEKTEIPPDQPLWGRSFSEIAERNREVDHQILEDAASNPGGDADLAKIGTYYKTCMGEAAIEAAGAKPIQPMLKEIEAVKDPKSLMAVAGRMQMIRAPVLFDLSVDPDYKDPGLDIAHVSQGGLGLPDRKYYLKDDEDSKKLLAAYGEHVAKMLELSGESPDQAKADSAAVVKFETQLAKASWPREELRDPEKTYHRIEIDGLQGLTPNLPWHAFLASMGHPDIKDVNVATPSFFKGVDAAVHGADNETLRAYLRWHLVNGVAPLLSKDFVEENFAFYGKRLLGQKEIRPRWKRCVAATDRALGEILGKYYVKRMFAGDSKTIAEEMIQKIEKAFQENLKSVSWMDDTTRQRAVGKMDVVYNKIGYPDKWRDYSKLPVGTSSYFDNAVAARQFDAERNAEKVGKPVDKSEWLMTPPTVNAYYNPLFNEMVFPAGIMQPPFFHKDYPAALNYGGMGMVMGHELTHGFDDQGRKFDPQGRMTQWWNESAIKKFETAASCVEKQYDGYEAQPGLHVNGKLTLGENIADLGGVKDAYHAYKTWEAEHGTPEPLVEGLTNDQLFFVGFAQGWCTKLTPQIEKLLVTVNPHSPPRFRVVGPLSDSADFAKAFSCKEGTPMNPKNRCEVW